MKFLSIILIVFGLYKLYIIATTDVTEFDISELYFYNINILKWLTSIIIFEAILEILCGIFILFS